MTITDDMLREAAAEFSTALAGSLPAPEACEQDRKSTRLNSSHWS